MVVIIIIQHIQQNSIIPANIHHIHHDREICLLHPVIQQHPRRNTYRLPILKAARPLEVGIIQKHIPRPVDRPAYRPAHIPVRQGHRLALQKPIRVRQGPALLVAHPRQKAIPVHRDRIVHPEDIKEPGT